jgi:hypothetical protein
MIGRGSLLWLIKWVWKSNWYFALDIYCVQLLFCHKLHLNSPAARSGRLASLADMILMLCVNVLGGRLK